MPRLLWIGSPFFHTALESCGWDAVAFHNFEEPKAYGWHQLTRLAGFTPDVLVVADKSRAPFVLGMEDFPCLTVFYSVDSHIHAWQPYYAQGFDACLVSLRDHIPRFAGAFLPAERIWWSPAFAWAEDAPRPDLPRDMDCLFVGTLNADLPLRAAFLDALGRRLPGLTVTRGNYRALYPRARVVLNHCEHADLNFRVFEAMGCGACLVTPRIGHGLTELFTEGEHMLCYAPDTRDGSPPDAAAMGNAVSEALAHIRFLLAHPQRAARMGQAALAAVNGGHRALHRARAFTGHVRELLPYAAALTARRRAAAGAVRQRCLRLLYLHWAEETPSGGLRKAYLAAAGGTFTG